MTDQAVEQQAPDQGGQPNAAQTIRVLHVQVSGAPTHEELKEVAAVFAAALDKGTNDAVVTNAHVMTSVEFHLADGNPIDLIYARQAMTPVEVTAVAYAAVAAASTLSQSWNELEENERELWVKDVCDFLNTGAVQNESDGGNLQVLCATVKALKPYMVAPASQPQVQLWTGEANLHADNAWVTIPFSGIKPQMIFKMDQYPGKYFVSTSVPRINYELTGCAWQIESSEAVVSGSKPIDEADLTMGFTLTWKLATVEQPAEQPALSPEQDPSVVTDVEPQPVAQETGTLVTDEAEAARIRAEVAEAVARGEVHLEGEVTTGQDAILQGLAQDVIADYGPVQDAQGEDDRGQDENTPGQEGSTL